MTENERKEAIKYIKSQLENGYLDLGLYEQNELEIIKEAIKMLKFVDAWNDIPLNMNAKIEFKNGSYIKSIESKETKHPARIAYIPKPIIDSEQCCYYCNNAYEDESCDGNWWLHCSCPKDEDCTMVLPSECCDKFC